MGDVANPQCVFCIIAHSRVEWLIHPIFCSNHLRNIVFSGAMPRWVSVVCWCLFWEIVEVSCEVPSCAPPFPKSPNALLLHSVISLSHNLFFYKQKSKAGFYTKRVNRAKSVELLRLVVVENTSSDRQFRCYSLVFRTWKWNGSKKLSSWLEIIVEKMCCSYTCLASAMSVSSTIILALRAAMCPQTKLCNRKLGKNW